ncbi:ANTAR domain-containing protein [Streptomyces megasporus]|uniref:ANTAR domain-containing protein n=1 Tax=Streptomyces megasporus TaxID=44060 RepID=UPI00068D2B63|nr:ANTAR domain-containing protein [Streptomyces megasporus]
MRSASRRNTAPGRADRLVLTGVVAALAAGALALEPVGELDRLRAEVAQLRRAMATRPVIDQARGMVMAAGRCTPRIAWEVLVEVSQHTNTKLHTVAARLVATTAGDPLPEPIRAALHTALRRRSRGPHRR